MGDESLNAPSPWSFFRYCPSPEVVVLAVNPPGHLASTGASTMARPEPAEAPNLSAGGLHRGGRHRNQRTPKGHGEHIFFIEAFHCRQAQLLSNSSEKQMSGYKNPQRRGVPLVAAQPCPGNPAILSMCVEHMNEDRRLCDPVFRSGVLSANAVLNPQYKPLCVIWNHQELRVSTFF